MLTVAHKPVLLKETIEALNVQPGKNYVDCTLGGGGHALAVLEKSSPGGRLLGIDADPEAIRLATVRLDQFKDSVILVNDNFSNLDEICRRYSFTPVQGILIDLGLSTYQLEEGTRGFSFLRDSTLDMRFGPSQSITAADIVNKASEIELALILREYGEEKFSQRIARRIVQERPINTSAQLATVVEKAVGRRGRIHPATRTFQALRIAVNHELEVLEVALYQTLSVLANGGRLVVISYHSLEDRIVKRFMQKEAQDCVCPPKIPVCRCNHKASIRIINKKVIVPTLEEISNNPRSRSAKMRIAEKIDSNRQYPANYPYFSKN